MCFVIVCLFMAKQLAEKWKPETAVRSKTATIDDIELATFEDSLYIQAVLEAIRASAESTTTSCASWVNVSVMQEEDEVVPLATLRHQRPSQFFN